jgi:hypothetical protein
MRKQGLLRLPVSHRDELEQGRRGLGWASETRLDGLYISVAAEASASNSGCVQRVRKVNTRRTLSLSAKLQTQKSVGDDCPNHYRSKSSVESIAYTFLGRRPSEGFPTGDGRPFFQFSFMVNRNCGGGRCAGGCGDWSPVG